MAPRNRSTTRKTGDTGPARLGRVAAWSAFALGSACAASVGLFAVLYAMAPGAARAASESDQQFTAKVDRTQISADESVSLKLTVQSDGSARMGEPRFQAPDFDVVNQYTGTYVESYYDSQSGRFGMRNNQQITQVLRPTKTGALRISGISVSVNGKTLTAPDIVVQVVGAGAGTPPPRGYGGGGIGLRGAGKKTQAGPSVKVRAEIDKDRVFKGEQVIVSYYLYRRVRVFNIQVDKFPVLNGFLREDLDMPVLGQRLDTERVVLDGAPYERSLLLRYAAYPLQSGKLKIDSTSLKYHYYPSSPGSPDGMDEEDPFLGFFRQMTPQQGQDRSEMLTVDVLPLPEEGKPNSFTGGVGDFTLVSAVDKYDVRANEALTLTVKIEGRGNLAAIGEPKAKWPENVELYDTKGTSKSGRLGVGEKVFEFLVIPRVPGEVVLPAMELSFFDPARRTYVTRTTEPIAIRVGDAAPGSAPAPQASRAAAPAGAPADAVAPSPPAEIAGLKPPGDDVGRASQPVWRWLYWACLAAFAGLLGLVGFDVLRKRKARSDERARTQAKTDARSWTRLHANAVAATQGAAWLEVVQSYEVLAGVVFDAIDQAHGLSARSRPRSQLKELLVEERGVPAPLWERVSRLLEHAEMVRFASSAGAVSESAARGELARWVTEGEAVVAELKRTGPIR